MNENNSTKFEEINLDGSWNSRDVASITGVKPGIVIRSASLTKLSPVGQKQLLDLNITDVIDLRSEREIQNDGIDQLPPAVNLHHLPIDAGDVSNFKDKLGGNIAESLQALMANPQADSFARDYMSGMYKKIISQPVSAAQLVSALKIIANAQGTTLIHCTAGKDRTGVTTMLLLYILGTDPALINQDYLYSNNYVDILQTNVGVTAGSEFMRSMMEVHPEYLQSALDEINAQYENIDDFLTKNGLTDDDRAKLRRKFK